MYVPHTLHLIPSCKTRPNLICENKLCYTNSNIVVTFLGKDGLSFHTDVVSLKAQTEMQFSTEIRGFSENCNFLKTAVFMLSLESSDRNGVFAKKPQFPIENRSFCWKLHFSVWVLKTTVFSVQKPQFLFWLHGVKAFHQVRSFKRKTKHRPYHSWHLLVFHCGFHEIWWISCEIMRQPSHWNWSFSWILWFIRFPGGFHETCQISHEIHHISHEICTKSTRFHEICRISHEICWISWNQECELLGDHQV